MKRFLSVLLAVMILFTCCFTATAAFQDEKKIDSKYLDAVTAMSEQKIISGFEDGSFQPEGTLTRAQAAKIICVMLEGEEKANALTAAQSSFTDVPASGWACKFVEYCAGKNIVSGTGKGKFNPNGKLTGAAFGKMLLVAFGADSAAFSGDKWVMEVQKALRANGNNYLVSAGEEPIQRQAACQMAYNFLEYRKIETALSQGYEESAISFANGKNAIKRGERTWADSKGFYCDYPADGVEFSLDFGGNLTLNLVNENSVYLTVFIDGAEYNRPLVNAGASSVTAATRVMPGTHTVRIIRDSEINTKGGKLIFTGISACCKASTVKAGEQKKLYIEFIGDSITAGVGTVGNNKTSPSLATNGASGSYAYQTAQLLDADYALVAKGGIGVTKENNGATSPQMYLAKNVYRDANEKFNFTRTPDVIVFAVGTNDKDSDESIYTNAAKAFVKTIREKEGNSPKIVFIYNMMVPRHLESTPQIAEELGGAASGVYSLKMVAGTNGVISTGNKNGHPSKADGAVNAKLLSEFIQSILK